MQSACNQHAISISGLRVIGLYPPHASLLRRQRLASPSATLAASWLPCISHDPCMLTDPRMLAPLPSVAIPNLVQLWLHVDLGLDPSAASADMTPMPVMAMMGAILCGAVADWLQARYNFSRLYTISVICAATFLLTVGMLYCDPPHRTGAFNNAGPQDQGQGSDALFWLVVSFQNFFQLAAIGPVMVHGMEMLPAKLSGSYVAAVYGVCVFTIGVATELCLDQSNRWLAESVLTASGVVARPVVSLNGHSGTISYCIFIEAAAVAGECHIFGVEWRREAWRLPRVANGQEAGAGIECPQSPHTVQAIAPITST